MTGSLRAVETLSRVDPDFEQLVGVLYGGALDPQDIWEDVFGKRAPQMSEKERRQRTEARVGLASNYVGLAAGAAGTASAAGIYRNARREKRGLPPKTANPNGLKARAGRLVPARVARQITPTRAAGAALGLQVANVGGDVVANRVLGRSAKGPKKVEKMLFADVEKFDVPKPVARMARGLLKFRQKASPATGINPKAQQRWQGAGEMVGGLVKTPARAIGSATVGTTAGVGTYQAGRRKERATYTGGQAPTPTVSKGGPELTWQGEFSKFDEDKRLAFGWASVVEKDGLPVVDRQGDYIAPEDMETAAYVYVQKSRVGGDMHRRTPDDRAVHASDLVESVVFTKEKIAKMGLPASTPIGWWVGFKVHDDEVWEQVKKGGRTGFSIHGRGRRRETTVDDVMKEHR